MKNNTMKIRIVILIALFTFQWLSVFSQYTGCGNCGANYPSGTFSTTSSTWSTITTCNYSGEYSYQSLTSGYIYQYDSHDTGYNTQLTLYTSTTCGTYSGYALAYNDDYNGTNSTLAYVPGTSSVRCLFSMFNCVAYGSGNTCGTLRWRAIPMTPTISAPSLVCYGGSVTLTASNIAADADDDFYMDCLWGSTSGGSEYASSGRSITINNVTSSITVYLRYRVNAGGSPGTQLSNVVSITINIVQPPTAPTGISGTTTICVGQSTTLTATGGSTGDGCTYEWYADGCGSGPLLGTGVSLNVTPAATTTYYVRRVGTSACSGVATGCANVTVTVQTLSVIPASINSVVNP